MRNELRTWLRNHAGLSAASLEAFLGYRALGVRITLAALAQDPASESLLAPELLLVLRALDRDPDRLRAGWPTDPRDLDTLAEAFGRPFTR